MNQEIKKGNILQLVEENFEDLELWYPVLRAREAGYNVVLAGKEKNKQYMGKYGVPATTEISFAEVKAGSYDGVLIPGGWAPDKLRRYPELLEIIHLMEKENKVMAQICHAGWVLVSADILKGKIVTSTPAIRDDMVNAGAHWKDESVVVDDYLISAQGPRDLPDYMKAVLERLETKHAKKL